MVLAHRLLFLRENRHLSQGDVERRTGLLRCYISRVENGHTVPAIENLEKLAHAMEVPLYEILSEGQEPPEPLNVPEHAVANVIAWGSSGKDARMLGNFRRLLGRVKEADRKLLLHMA
jgi:transcriptional regulator with XRE-family HTH domain